MAPRVDLEWPRAWSVELSDGVFDVIHAVSELGGAIGWMSPPPHDEVDRWLRAVLDATAVGDAALCIARREGRLAAMGLWRRDEAHYFHHMAELVKIMAHPQARGLRLGAAVTQALIGNATEAGIETLVLGVRGNNHLAVELYESVGFTVWGRLPNVIEVGNERFDDVRMFLDLGRPTNVILNGSTPSGPGSSQAPRAPS